MSRLGALPGWAIVVAGLIVGLVAETGWPAGVAPWIVAADLAVGWLLVVAAVVVRGQGRRPGGRIAVLLLATGFAWFAGTLIPAALFLHRGPLLHLVASHPTGRLRTPLLRSVVVGGYLVAAIAPLSALDWVGVAFGAIVVLAALARPTRPDPAALAGAAVGIVLAGTSAARMAGLSNEVLAIAAYDIAVAGLAIAVAGEAMWRRSSGIVTRVVVDLGGASESGTLRTRLAQAIGDPTLVIGYAVEGSAEAFVDDAGAPVRRPASAADRAVASIDVGGRPVGFVAYDPVIVDDPRIVGLIASAAGLAITNAATQVAIRSRVDEVAASRERLVNAADAQRRRIEASLERGPEARLGRVGMLLDEAAGTRPDDRRLGDARRHLADARQRLREFGAGLYPSTLSSGGLAAAIRELAARSPRPVELRGFDDASVRGDPATELTLWFVCAESLANVDKHARATRAIVELTRTAGGGGHEHQPGRVMLAIEDDGIGGARIDGGSGLRGLVDRVEAVGGEMTVRRSALGGTRVEAILPDRPIRATPGRTDVSVIAAASSAPVASAVAR